MSLLRLLSVGRSLGRISDPPNRYRMTQQSLLPKFGGVEKTADEMVAGMQKQEPQRGSILKKLLTALARNRAAKHKKTMKRIEADAPTVAPQAFPRGRWTFFRSPFSCTAKPKSTEAPVQGELSLDSVRPVRNDLSDSDLEVTRSTRPSGMVLAQPIAAEGREARPVNAAGPTRAETQLSGVGKT
jgi:hypothetical protein